jgi:hypothetical protein
MAKTRSLRYVDCFGRYHELNVGPEFGLTDDEWRERGCPVGLRYKEEVDYLFRQLPADEGVKLPKC